MLVGLLLKIPPWRGLEEDLRPVGPALRVEDSAFNMF